MSPPLRQQLDADATAPVRARRFALGAVARLVATPLDDRVREDLELVVSELVTNAVRAESATVRVSVAYERGRIVVGVEDDGGGWPQPRVAGVHDTTGRGLALVSAVSASWGVRLSGPGRKTVWAELETAGPDSAGPDRADSQSTHR